MTTVYIVGSVRTPLGASISGGFAEVPAPKLGAVAAKECLARSGVSPNDIDELYAGNVISAGIGQNPAKQCSLEAGLPNTVPCTTINKVCCSSLKALTLAAQDIKYGEVNTAVVVGMENMTLAPHLVRNARKIQKMGTIKFKDEVTAEDGMIVDGLWDSFNNIHMGALADHVAAKYGITREEQDRYAIQSFARAKEGWASGFLDIIEFNGVKTDEIIPKLIVEKVPTLRPCFVKDGTITAANASAISDGGVAMVLVSESYLKEHSLKPIAKIIAYTDVGCDPAEFICAPVLAAKKVLEKAKMKFEDIDLFEVNEAFAVAPLLFMKETGVPEEKVNVFGGAIAIGHPLGCSGLRIVNTLISALKAKGKRIGLATLCNGGGGSTAVIIELT
ncbi:acetyl-CoA C-acetyltransferase [Histomonas meleagridis]|uniref:acetyl-CoA C-acetyltransferase n=1 Tax=Histomonas meleagridis TaxID=135588 RepID=UPI00355938E2|nr:acetyl-CoA C-acetyltransferase [Histomonas meleagridis]KAH0800579.1 acetyl-CoA C-acetyltransferase [Histomonas meleagridis]